MNKKGLLLVNLGTPDSPSVKDVRKYLNEFLMDGRVIDINPLLRAILVKGMIVPFRATSSAKLYKEIWDKDSGSPLLHYNNLQLQLLKMELGGDYHVELAMRYQYPSIKLALQKLMDAGVGSIKVIPLFPQYASATTGSIYQKVMEIVSQWPTIPKLEFVNSFHDHPLLIKAFADKGPSYLPDEYDHILFSFHGLPQRQLIKADASGNHCQRAASCCKTLTVKNRFCYAAQCYDTARLIAQQLNISKDRYTVCFQSRLGNTPWIEPYTSAIIEALARAGKKRVLVFCPAFVADCLETIHEIGTEYKEAFLKAGGEQLQLVEGLNDSPIFIELLKELAVG